MFILFLGCKSQNEIERASYLSGYETYLSLKNIDTINIDDIDNIIANLKEQGEDLSAMNWDAFKEGFADAKTNKKPKYEQNQS